ncbi:26S proteasome regulatory subunit 6B [Galemys pyrenaicus]|uniref:26S proteasome regulatory subunit 6B n=1 Tax=Galemys pyrenaicus TaxID=202257 RepID=A0A8J6A0I4_GALPY|nr:26S proteasome regulatory subunit 6B [Galemys pyrenaicus]
MMYADVRGINILKQEVREAVELLPTHLELYKQIRMDPPEAEHTQIIFIDEIDAITTKRFDAQTGADREVQRILLELLKQMDGFDQNLNVKMSMATSRADTLEPALLWPGRLDCKIEFPFPDRRQKRLIFSAITSKMTLSEEVDPEDYERGMLAIRDSLYLVLAKDFEKAYKTVIKKDEQEHEFYK